MRDSTERCLNVLLAVALVGTMMWGPVPVGTAAADHECAAQDLTLGLAVTAGAEARDTIFGGDASSQLDGQDKDGSELFGCDLFHGSAKVDEQVQNDKTQTANEISQAAATSVEWANNKLIGWENGRQGLEVEARLDGLAAYGRALDNGSSKAVAKQKAANAVSDYFAVRKNNLVTDWNVLALSFVNYNNKSLEEGMSGFFVGATDSAGTTYRIDGVTNVSRSLGNQSSTTVVAPVVDGTATTPWRGNSGYWFVIDNMDDYPEVPEVNAPKPGEFASEWTALENKETNVTEELDTYINQTHEAVQDGNITWSQAVGASTIARNFAAEGNFQSWAATRLANIDGVGLPKNLSTVGYYKIAHGSQVSKGVLASDGNPPSGAFETGVTYNGSELPGPQYLIGESGVTDLDGPFTIESITNADGEQVNKTVIKRVNYTATNASDLGRILEEQQRLRAQLEARENKLRNQTKQGCAGPFCFGSGLPYGGAGVVAVVGGLVVLSMLTRN